MSTRVAGCATLVGATAQLLQDRRTRPPTMAVAQTAVSAMTGRELRAQLRTQQGRNSQLRPGIAELGGVAPAVDAGLPAKESTLDAATEAHRQRVLAMLR